MPCSCDHYEPNQAEQESKRACQCLVYVLKTQQRCITPWIINGADSDYGVAIRLKEATVKLCDLCNAMNPVEKDKIIYNGRNAEARKLADWWDEHQKADAERIKEEEQAKKKEKLKQSALSKLTPEEKKAILNQFPNMPHIYPGINLINKKNQ